MEKIERSILKVLNKQQTCFELLDMGKIWQISDLKIIIDTVSLKVINIVSSTINKND